MKVYIASSGQCPKENFISKKKIYLAVVEAASEFSEGSHKTELARTPKEHTFQM
jgi:hypothetical protein